MNQKRYMGQCHCGHVLFGFSGKAITCYACHCTDCQKSSGTAFSTNMLVERVELTHVSGTTEIIEYEFNNRVLQRHQCCRCATALWLNYSDKIKYASIQTGTFQSQDWFEPIAHLWLRSSLPWIPIPDHQAKFETQPELSDLIALWHSKHKFEL